MKNILWVTTDDSNMSTEHHRQLTELYMKEGIWVKCYCFTDMTSMFDYTRVSDEVDIIACDETFPLHLLWKILRNDKECIVATRVMLSRKDPSRTLNFWNRIDKCEIGLTECNP